MTGDRITSFLISLLFSIHGIALQRNELTNNNIKTKISNSNSFFVITEDICITDQFDVGENSVLCFEGGCFRGTGNIKLKNTEISAPPYQIFGDSVELTGTIKNPTVSAEWFGEPGNDASKMINRALSSVIDKNIVSLESSHYLISSPIVLNQKGQRLKCSGTIVMTQSDSVALRLGESNLYINIHRLESYPDLGTNPFASFKGTALQLYGNVYNSNVEVGSIYGFKKGIDISPWRSYYNSKPHAGVQYTRFKFNKITCQTGIYIDIYGDIYEGNRGDNTQKIYSTWCNENQFSGGVITAENGIDIVEMPHRNVPKFEVNGNVFSNIDFVDVTGLPINMNNECHDYYRDLNFKGATLKCPTLIKIADSKFCRLNLKSELSGDKIKSGDNCYGVILDGAFYLDFFKDRIPYLDRMAIFSNQNWGTGPTTKYLTSSLSGIGMMNTINVPDVIEIAPKDTTIFLKDLLTSYKTYKTGLSLTGYDSNTRDFELNPDVPAIPWPGLTDSEVRLLSESCLIKVGKGNNVYLNLQGKGYVNYPIYVKLEVSALSSVILRKGQNNQPLISGHYLLTFKAGGEPEMQRL